MARRKAGLMSESPTTAGAPEAPEAPEAPHMRRNVFVLVACQALAMSGATMTVVMSGLAGMVLAADKSWATAPFALQFVGVGLATMPASWLMGIIGRRAGFTLGQAFGILGAAICGWSLFEGSFLWLAAGSFVLGVHNAFWQYYRFAAADTATSDFRPKAISYVMTGGVAAAFAGPQLFKAFNDSFAPVPFAGAYGIIAVLCIVAIVLLQFVRIPKPEPGKADKAAGRPRLEIARQPAFIVAVLSAMIGYGTMNLIMTATPLAMQVCGFTPVDSATVIQWHALAMFAPSFFTGHLIKKFGVLNIILVGTVCNAVCMAVNLSGVEFSNFIVGLMLLGVGWNFMFIGGTTLVTEAYRPEEKSKVQGMNDFLVFTMVAVSSLGSGVLHAELGWAAVNMAVAPPVFAVFAMAVWFRTRQEPKTAS